MTDPPLYLLSEIAEASAAVVAPPSTSPPAPDAPEAPAEASAAEAPASPKVVVVEAERDHRGSMVSGSGCTSQASQDDEDDATITDIYFVSCAFIGTTYMHTHLGRIP